jgi:hypothetical protein
MASEFDWIGFHLDRRIADLPESMRPLAFLALAERYLSVFELHEKQRSLTGRLRECLDALWAGARGHGAAMVGFSIERLVPDEWVSRCPGAVHRWCRLLRCGWLGGRVRAGG